MKKNRDESWVGDTTLWIYERIKNMDKCNHSVGGMIPKNQDHEWDKLRQKLELYGVNMNKGGLIFVVRWINTIMDATCPLAVELGEHPIGFTDDKIKMFADIINNLDKKHWVENSANMRNDISNDTKNQIILNLKSMLVKIKS